MPNSLAAPQANLMASVASGVLGGQLPWDLIGLGAAIGVVIISIDEWLRWQQATWRMPVLAVAVGIYLPLELSVPIAGGGLIAWLATRQSGPATGGSGILYAAGLITGEALVGILMAVPIVVSSDREVLAAPASWQLGPIVGATVLLLVGYLIFRSARQANPD